LYQDDLLNSFFKLGTSINQEETSSFSSSSISILPPPKLEIRLSPIKMTNKAVGQRSYSTSLSLNGVTREGSNHSSESNLNNNNNNNNIGSKLLRNDSLFSYLDNETDIELVDSLKSNLLKAVKVFQKPYYQVEIKGKVVVVPSWRMKEKVC
jgi:hypothetical protein